MGAFDARFLVWGARVTVVEPGAPLSLIVKLDLYRIRELGPVVCDEEGEELLKGCPAQELVKLIKDSDDGLGCISFPHEQEQHGGLLEV